MDNGDIRVFCTYFDLNYIARGLSLYKSLQETGSNFCLYVLCLDNESFDYLSVHGGKNLILVPLAELEKADPELAAIKGNRSVVEYYFTCTGAFSLYVMNTSIGCQAVTYLDSDLYFFQSPEIIFKEIGESSVAIISHRFTKNTYLNRRSGIFNVGWITWKNDDEGLSCLNNYRKNTIDWCYDYSDGRRFADQRYLDTWPVDYRNVCVISHPGANVAPWNIDAAPMLLDDGKVMVAGHPLVFFHFHGHKRRADGGFERSLTHYVRDHALLPIDPVIEAIYAPYEAVMNSFDVVQNSGSVRVRPTGSPVGALPEWEYRGRDWGDAGNGQPGWNAPSSITAMERRALMIRRRTGLSSSPMGGDLNMHNQAMVLAYAIARAAQGKKRLSILDWQGGLGAGALQLTALLPEVNLDYVCLTSPEMALRGQKLSPETEFVTDFSDITGRQFDFVIFNGTLQCEAEWQRVLRHLPEYFVEWVLVMRVPIVSSTQSFVNIRRLHNTDYGTDIQQWSINIREFEKEISGIYFEIDREFLCSERSYVPDAPEQFEAMSFLCRAIAEKN